MGKLNNIVAQAITEVQDGLGILKEGVKKADTAEIEQKVVDFLEDEQFEKFAQRVASISEDIKSKKDK